ncbi:MAG: alpha/beta hydrolase [Ferruginibacter sp.]|nr:alpha/beta hydrolase [Ferruginibacter sp.]
MKKVKWVLLVLTVLIITYILGPHPRKPIYDSALPLIPGIDSIENYITRHESAHKIKPGNEARIVWANDSAHRKTEYVFIYLHGFSASQEEGNPVHRNIAKKFGCNLFLSRLSQHGIDTSEQLMQLTADNYWESAKEALAIGKKLGNKVILMGTSTGATQSLQLAAAYPEDVAGLILYSPNVAINDGNAWLLNNPWGLQIARMVKKGKYHDPDDLRPIYRQYWNKPYRLEALVQLEEMLETTMNESTFKKINQPVLMLYYYKDEANQDKVVKVSAMKGMFQQLSTPSPLKRAMPLPNTGDHVLASPIKSKDILSVENETASFLKDVLKMPVKN